VARDFLAAVPNVALQKPFDTKELARVVRRLTEKTG
jgi:hypothetical protein